MFKKESATSSATLFPTYLGINRNVEDLVLSGPFQDVALELVDLSLQIESTQFVKDLSYAFKSTSYDATPELRPNSNWYVWKAQLQIQHPHLTLPPADWVRLWNIYFVLHQQFSKDWSPAQLAWVTTWLLETVSMDHFQLQKPTQSTQARGALSSLQDPVLTAVYTELINDPGFKQHLLTHITQSEKYNPKLKFKVRSPQVVLDQTMDSQILVEMTFRTLYGRLKEALEDHNWAAETRSGILIPEDIHLYVADLFSLQQNQNLALQLLEKLFVGAGFPISEVDLQKSLRASVKKQIQPIVAEAQDRGKSVSASPSAPIMPIIALQPIPLASAQRIVEQQPYLFKMARNANLGEQVLIFAPGSLKLFAVDSKEQVDQFVKAIQYGFTDAHGSNGLKKLISDNYYELKPGYSYYRMVVRRDQKTWTVEATLHKDDVARFKK